MSDRLGISLKRNPPAQAQTMERALSHFPLTKIQTPAGIQHKKLNETMSMEKAKQNTVLK